MLFQHVAIAGLAHIDAPRRLSSDEINARLKPTLTASGSRPTCLATSPASTRGACGTATRRFPTPPPWPAEGAGDAGIDPDKVGLLVNTSVSRDYLEPSTVSIVSGNLGLPTPARTSTSPTPACVFINGMDIASRMIERGEIDYALIVDGETANLAYEKTLDRMTRATSPKRTSATSWPP